MAGTTVNQNPAPAFLVFPTRTPVYLWRIVAVETNRTISRHKELEAAYVKAEELNSRLTMVEPDETLPQCSWEDPFQDAGYPCYELGTVTHREIERPYCPKHFCMLEVGL